MRNMHETNLHTYIQQNYGPTRCVKVVYPCIPVLSFSTLEKDVVCPNIKYVKCSRPKIPGCPGASGPFCIGNAFITFFYNLLFMDCNMSKLTMTMLRWNRLYKNMCKLHLTYVLCDQGEIFEYSSNCRLLDGSEQTPPPTANDLLWSKTSPNPFHVFHCAPIKSSVGCKEN